MMPDCPVCNPVGLLRVILAPRVMAKLFEVLKSNVVFASVVQIDENLKDKKILEKIVLVDVQKEIFPDIEKTLINLLHNSGYPAIKIEKKIDFEELYKKNFN